MAVIDLSQLPAPQIVDVPDFETLLAERKAAFVALYPADEQDAVRRTLALESEPVTKLLQESTYREILLRQRINEAAQAVMVAYALGGDLDQLAANYNVKRLTVTPADNDAVPPVAAVMESDEALRLRVPAAFEGLSVAGPTAAYEFHARSADGRVADASATSPAPAEVVLTVLSREGDGTAAAELLAKLGFAPDVCERVCYLIGHHHTYTNIDGMDYQILVEADFLVNFYEDGMSKEAIQTACGRIFKTASGIRLCRHLHVATQVCRLPIISDAPCLSNCHKTLQLALSMCRWVVAKSNCSTKMVTKPMCNHRPIG